MYMNTRGKTNRLRIIGGQWRGRRFNFPVVNVVRPTPNRVKETLFNWLAAVTTGARCLDLFTGSGALGLEALSRGACEVIMIDSNAEVINCLQQHLEVLNAQNARLLCCDALDYLDNTGEPFDNVFLDPPYGLPLVFPCCERLEQNGWLAEQARIYFETHKGESNIELPENWHLLRSKNAGRVGYHLAIRE